MSGRGKENNGIKEIRRLDVLPKTYTEVYCEVKVTYDKAWMGEILVGFLVGGAKLLQLKASKLLQLRLHE